MTNTEWLESELAEERRIRKMQAEVVKEALDSRDAALAEVERWKADYDRESKACEENAREMQEARAEAEALRAALRAIAGQHGTPDCSGCWWFQHEADIVLARLSPPAPDPFDRLKLGDAGGTVFAKPAPAPAPKVDEERLMENLKDFKTFDNRMHGKPAPETAKCPNLPGHETHSPPCGLDYSILDPKHGATARPPAAASAPCRWGTSGVYCLEHGDWRKRGDERCPSAPGGRKE